MKYDDGSEPQRATAVAEALAGLSPSALQDFLAAHPDAVGEIVKPSTRSISATRPSTGWAKDLLPDLPIPGAGRLKDLTIDQIQDWVKDSLHEDARSAAEATPST